MKIQIIQADEESWYKTRIGKIYIARENEHVPDLYILRNYRTLLRGVKKIHAKIVER